MAPRFRPALAALTTVLLATAGAGADAIAQENVEQVLDQLRRQVEEQARLLDRQAEEILHGNPQ